MQRMQRGSLISCCKGNRNGTRALPAGFPLRDPNAQNPVSETSLYAGSYHTDIIKTPSVYVHTDGALFRGSCAANGCRGAFMSAVHRYRDRSLCFFKEMLSSSGTYLLRLICSRQTNLHSASMGDCLHLRAAISAKVQDLPC